MKLLDRVIQYWRIRVATPYLRSSLRLLDVGCGDGTLFRCLRGSVREGVGIDPSLTEVLEIPRVELFSNRFPDGLPEMPPFDGIAMLAVFEHVPTEEQSHWVEACHGLLKPGGVTVLTVPSTRVDFILKVLRFLRLVDGIALEEHHGFKPEKTPELFEAGGFELKLHEKFQLRLNNLFVFKKPVWNRTRHLRD